MSEKFPVPHVDRLVGDKNLSSEEISKFFDIPPSDENGTPVTGTRELLTEVFQKVSSDPERFKDIEVSKTERELYVIHIETQAIKKFASEFGRKDFVDIPEANIHILKEGGVSESTGGCLVGGSHATVLGEIMVDRKSDLQTAITIFHELWHTLASYNAIQVTTEGAVSWYRGGLGIKSRDGKERFFYHIDEALTGLMTKRFFEEIVVTDASFADEIKSIKEKGEEVDTTRSSELDKFLDYVDNIYERNKDDFQSRDEIINLFLQGQVTGNILPIARLIEKTYGKGSFRDIGEFTGA